MKKIFLPLLLMIFFVTGCGGSQVVKYDKIIIGLDDEFAPMGFRDENGKLVGFDIDLAKEMGKRLGVKLEFKPIGWDKKKEAITSGDVDIIWNGLDITDKRKEYMIFTKPYMDDRQIFLIKDGSDQNINSEGDLAEKIVGVQSGSTAENYFEQEKALKNSFAGFKGYEKFKDGLDALTKDEIDVFVCDELIARYEINQHPGKFNIIDVKTGFVTEVGIGFRKEDVELRDKVQKVFDKMVKDGTARKISKKWFQADLIKM